MSYDALDAIVGKEHAYEVTLTEAQKVAVNMLGKEVRQSKSPNKEVLKHSKQIRSIISDFGLPNNKQTVKRIQAAVKGNTRSNDKVTSSWQFSKEKNGWVSKTSDAGDFLCDQCGLKLSSLGFQECSCGKIWNGFTIDSDSKESSESSRLTVWREVESRNDMKVATNDVEDTELSQEDAEKVPDLPVDELVDDPVYDYDTKESQFVSGYVAAKKMQFLKQGAHPYYSAGYKKALGIL